MKPPFTFMEPYMKKILFVLFALALESCDNGTGGGGSTGTIVPGNNAHEKFD